jgi:hypothetical protein
MIAARSTLTVALCLAPALPAATWSAGGLSLVGSQNANVAAVPVATIGLELYRATTEQPGDLASTEASEGMQTEVQVGQPSISPVFVVIASVSVAAFLGSVCTALATFVAGGTTVADASLLFMLAATLTGTLAAHMAQPTPTDG